MPGTWAAAALYFALTMVLMYPLSLAPQRTVIADDPDQHLFMWTLAWDTHAFVHQPLHIFDANIFYPNHATLAYSENLIGSAFFAAPVLWLTGNPVLAVNVVSLLSCVLCGLGAYVLGRRLGMSGPAALLCGMIFAFSPPRFFRFNQLHLTVVQWIPFSLASIHAYLDGGRRRDLLLATAFFTLEALSSGHGAVFLIIGVATLLIYRGVMGEPIAWRRRVADLGVMGTLLLLVPALTFIPYRAAQVEVGLRRGLGSWDTVPESFIASPTRLHIALLSLFTSTDVNATASAYLFPGYVPLLLAGVALVWWKRRNTPAASTWPQTTRWNCVAGLFNVAAVAAATLGVTIAVFGPVRLRAGSSSLLTARSALRAWLMAAVFVAGRIAAARYASFSPVSRLRVWATAWRQWAAPRRLNPVPVYFLITLIGIGLSLGPPISLWPLVYWLPGFNFIRVPSRFTILGLVGLAVLAGIGFDRLSAGLGLMRQRAAAAIAGAVLVAEFAAWPMTGVPYRVEIPAADQWLARQPKPFAIVEVPITASERYHSNYMLHSMAHWQKTVSGYSGIRPPSHDLLFDEIRQFPSEESLRHLAQIGVGYVVVHTSLVPAEQMPAFESGLRTLSPWLTLEYSDAEARVYSLHRPATPSEPR